MADCATASWRIDLLKGYVFEAKHLNTIGIFLFHVEIFISILTCYSATIWRRYWGAR